MMTLPCTLMRVQNRYLGAPDLSWIFEKDAFAEVPFVTVLPEYSERCFYGIIDRLIMQDETVFVVDFKTNRAIPGNHKSNPRWDFEPNGDLRTRHQTALSELRHQNGYFMDG